MPIFLLSMIEHFYYNDSDDLYSNSYLVYDKNNRCIAIDPSKDDDGLTNYINRHNLTLVGILLTHGHFDHIRGVKRLVDNFSCPVYISFEEVDMLKDPYLNCSRYMSEDYVLDIEVNTLNDGQILKIIDYDILCIAVPFHTKGSMCFYLKDHNVLFTGDFLFHHAIGRSDLPTGTPKTLFSSFAKLDNLPDNTMLLTGHENRSSLGAARDFFKCL